MEDDAILLHGGAGSDNSYSERLEKYAKSVDVKNGALDACVDAVRILEDDPDFNAGTGSVKRLDGSTQMDAAVMVAEGFGSVIGIERVKNPVDVARLVMEKTPHLILEGDGAISFARKMGFPEYDPSTEKTQRMWKKTVEYLQGIGESIPERYEKYRKYALALFHNGPLIYLSVIGGIGGGPGGMRGAFSTGTTAIVAKKLGRAIKQGGEAESSHIHRSSFLHCRGISNISAYFLYFAYLSGMDSPIP